MTEVKTGQTFATVIRETRIPMPDGVALAATLYLPPDADTIAVPVVLEYLPYRKDDAVGRTLELNSYLTRRGIAGARASEEPATATAIFLRASTPSRSSATPRS